MLWLVAVAAYLPLHSLPGAEALLDRSWSPAVAALLTQQVREPLEERLARSFIPHLTAIADDVSLKVKQQYEENPYPRWVKPAPAGEPKTMQQYFGDWFKPHPGLGRPDQIDILVAGCGTGQNLVETARQFKGARVLAVDLSLASLCYAKRQALALGLTNIAFAEADILKLGGHRPQLRHRGCERRAASHGGSLGRLAGAALAAAAGRLHAGRPLQQARALDINAARAFVAERGFASTPEDIRRSRQEILALADGEPAKNVVEHISISSPPANAATCSFMCRSIR